jgi:predicted cobalt transporter CbtA
MPACILAASGLKLQDLRRLTSEISALRSALESYSESAAPGATNSAAAPVRGSRRAQHPTERSTTAAADAFSRTCEDARGAYRWPIFSTIYGKTRVDRRSRVAV